MKAFQMSMLSKKYQQNVLQKNIRSARFVRRNFGMTKSFFQSSKSRRVHAMGLFTAYAGLAGVLSLCPLEEFERIERNNVAYHHHLHPR
jgi:hypothetical protein